MKTIWKVLIVFVSMILIVGIVATFILSVSWMEEYHPAVCGVFIAVALILLLFDIAVCIVGTL